MITVCYRVGRGTGLFRRMFIRIQGHCVPQDFGYIFVSPRFCQRPYQKALRTVVIHACVLGEIRLKISRSHFTYSVYELTAERLGKQLVTVQGFQSGYLREYRFFLTVRHSANYGVCVRRDVYSLFAVLVLFGKKPRAVIGVHGVIKFTVK